jgi:hypothetical protein
MEHNRVIIVGTIPYNKNTSSRAFDAYFHNWEKQNMRQIFSNTKTPVKGHCGSLYQITDHRLLKRWMHKIDEVGVIFDDKDLPIEWENTDLEVGSNTVNLLYKIGSKDSPLKYILRGVLWKEKYWNTPKLNNWLDEFQPECVFLAFSDDYFIPRIALYISKKYNIPIMSCIGDDYYFNDRKSVSPFYHIYRKTYKQLINKIFQRPGSAMYIGNKIRDKYNAEFGLNGETVYLTSDIKRHDFKPVNIEEPGFIYCGNIRLGRNNSLAEIGYALQKISSNYYIDVYSTEKNREFIKVLEACPGIRFHGAVSYSEVMRLTAESDVTIIVEGFSKQDVDTTRYSLSTKAADAIASGSNIFVYGDLNCGVIEYMQETGCAVVCHEKDELQTELRKLIFDKTLQKQLYDRAIIVDKEDHDKEKNRTLTENMFVHLINDTRKRNAR